MDGLQPPAIVAPRKPHPLAAVHPRAYRACLWLNRATAYFALVIPGVILLFLCCSPFALLLIFVSPRAAEVALMGGVLCLGLAVLGIALAVLALAAVNFMIIAAFFIQYSLAQMLGVYLFAAACVTGIVALPSGWKAVPIMLLLGELLVVFIFIARHDPTGPDYLQPAAEVALPSETDATT
jgi:hypothetical protein